MRDGEGCHENRRHGEEAGISRRRQREVDDGRGRQDFERSDGELPEDDRKAGIFELEASDPERLELQPAAEDINRDNEQQPGAKESVQADVSARNVAVTSSFNGTEIVIFGAVDNNAGGLAYQSSGVAVPVRPDSWCVTSKKVNKRGKMRYAARVLGRPYDLELLARIDRHQLLGLHECIEAREVGLGRVAQAFLRLLREHSLTEISAELGESEQAVASLIKRGLSRLRTQLLPAAARLRRVGSTRLDEAVLSYLRHSDLGTRPPLHTFIAEYPDCVATLAPLLTWLDETQAALTDR